MTCLSRSKPPTHCQCGLELSTHHVIGTQQPKEGESEQSPREVRLVVVQSVEEKKNDKPADQLQQPPPQQIKWDPEIHTVPSDPDSYGTLFFDGFGQEASRKAPVSVFSSADCACSCTTCPRVVHLDVHVSDALSACAGVP